MASFERSISDNLYFLKESSKDEPHVFAEVPTFSLAATLVDRVSRFLELKALSLEGHHATVVRLAHPLVISSDAVIKSSITSVYTLN